MGMKEWICEEVQALTIDGKVVSTMLHQEQELVRCKDCKHSHPWYADKSICELWADTGVDVFNDGFCSYGERKDDEEQV